MEWDMPKTNPFRLVFRLFFYPSIMHGIGGAEIQPFPLRLNGNFCVLHNVWNWHRGFLGFFGKIFEKSFHYTWTKGAHLDGCFRVVFQNFLKRFHIPPCWPASNILLTILGQRGPILGGVFEKRLIFFQRRSWWRFAKAVAFTILGQRGVFCGGVFES